MSGIADAVARVTAHLVAHPEDGYGWGTDATADDRRLLHGARFDHQREPYHLTNSEPIACGLSSWM